MNIDLINIIAASALIVPSAATVVLAVLNRQKSKRIKLLESCKKNLSELLAEEKRVSQDREDSIEGVHMGEVQVLEQEIRSLQSALYDASQSPLANISDEDLGHVVQKELIKRVALVRQASLPWGNTAHQLATSVGGKCFRVVDHCKRGHGAFKDFGPYHDPKAVDATMAPTGCPCPEDFR